MQSGRAPMGGPDLGPWIDEVVAAVARGRRRLSAAWVAGARGARAIGKAMVWHGADAARIVGDRLVACSRQEALPARPLVCVAVLLVCGGWLAAACGWSVTAWGGAAVVALLVWGGCVRRARAVWAREWGAAVALAAAIVTAMAAWTSVRLDLFSRHDLAWSLGDAALPVAVEGVVVEAARSLRPMTAHTTPTATTSASRSECVLALTAVRDGAAWRVAAGRARLIVAGAGIPLVPGSLLRVYGRGLRPAPALNPGEFDQRQRARLNRVLSVIRTQAEGVEHLATASAWWPTALLERARAAGTRVLERHIGPDRAGLAAALLLGSREALDPETSRDFLVTGTVHILSISGLHVGILAAALAATLRTARVPRVAGLVIVALVTGGYAVMVGAQTPVVRATLVVWLACVGAACGRPGFGLNSLAVAAIVIALWHPADTLLVGTQLSFLSTAVLVGVVTRRSPLADDPIERLIDAGRSPTWRWCRRRLRDLGTAVVAGAAVWLVTVPLVAARFHVVSPVALLLNPLLAPLVALAMGWGFLCLLAAPLSAPLAAVCGWLCDGALAATAGLVALAAALPAGHAWTPAPPEWWVVGAYVVVLAVLLWLPAERLRQPLTWGAVILAWGMFGVAGVTAAGLLRPAAPRVEATVAAMGHGCGIVVRGPAGGCLVYDAGRLGAPAAASRGVAAILWAQGLRRIDTLVVSHADADHFNGVPDLLDRFAVGRLVVPGALVTSRAPAVRDLLARAEHAGVGVVVARAGDTIPFEPLCRVRVLHPHAGEPAPGGDDNQSSVVLSIEAAGRRLLLTGDLDGPALERFVADGPGPCDALVAPHHGSLSALATGVVAATQPDWVFVSGTGGDRWATVSSAYARAGTRRATVLRSGGDGAIAVVLSAEAVTVRQHRAGRWEGVTRGEIALADGTAADASGPCPAPGNRRAPLGTVRPAPAPARTANLRPRGAGGSPRGT
ncbi:MAG: ComEC/Rec2 family competence protein [Planctomycetia bacterium]|nr:ComEC/Rec2 family competence protein [Planctomycetia bacterium]